MGEAQENDGIPNKQMSRSNFENFLVMPFNTIDKYQPIKTILRQSSYKHN